MNIVVILLGGASQRVGLAVNKAYLRLGLRYVCEYPIMVFAMHPDIDHIILVHRQQDNDPIQHLCTQFAEFKPISTVLSGQNRQASSFAGLKLAAKIVHNHPDSLILFHNGCNPFVSSQDISHILNELTHNNNVAVAVAQPVTSTLRRVSAGRCVETVSRKGVWQMQTPQAMTLKMAQHAFECAQTEGVIATDDCELVLRLGYDVKIVRCSEQNFKITTHDDLILASALVMSQGILVGMGEDSHRLDHATKGLWLGGVFFAQEIATLAHSDGDVILHALYNAISGALGGDSLGRTFPDNHMENHKRSSTEFIDHIQQILHKRQMGVHQIVLSITAPSPNIDPIASRIRRKLSELFTLEVIKIGITANSGEQMDIDGHREGIHVMAMVALGPVHDA